MNEPVEKMTPEISAFIEEWKSKPGNLIMVLHQVQQTYGYIPRNIAIEISERLSVPLAKIYGVVTFYNFFKLEKELGIGLNSTTPDGQFSIEAVRCLGRCGLAPGIVGNGNVHGRLTAKDVPAIIEQYRKQG